MLACLYALALLAPALAQGQVGEPNGRLDVGAERVQVAAGAYHAVAVDSHGRAWAWGDNQYGQLGTGACCADSNVPVEVTLADGAPLVNVVAVAAGYYHSLALVRDPATGASSVFAWGDARRGQLGLGGTTTPAVTGPDNCDPTAATVIPCSLRARPVLTAAGVQLTNVRTIAGGANVSAAIVNAGGNTIVRAWGDNAAGQLARNVIDGPNRCNGTSTDDCGWYAEPVLKAAAANLTDVSAIAIGASHVLAVVHDAAGPGTGSTVRVWGQAVFGTSYVLGRGTQAGNATCGSATCQTLAAWDVQSVDGAVLKGVVSVAAGNNHSIAVVVESGTAQRTAWTWGAFAQGQLGRGTTGASNTQASRVTVFDATCRARVTSSCPGTSTPLTGVISVAAFANRSHAVVAEGPRRYVYGWGSNIVGTAGAGLGIGETPTGSTSGFCTTTSSCFTSAARAKLGGIGPGNDLTDVVGIGGGANAMYNTRSDGSLVVWGNGDNGEFGNGANTDLSLASTTGSHFAAGIRFVQVAAACGRSYALRGDGTVWAWGSDLDGGLSQGTTAAAQTSGMVQVRTGSSTPLTGVISIRAGCDHALALDGSGQVWAWGSNAAGQGGQGDTTVLRSPYAAKVRTNAAPNTPTYLESVISISARGNHSRALHADGTTWGWGANDRYQMANGPTPPGAPALESCGGISCSTFARQAQTSAGVSLKGIAAVAAGPANGYAVTAFGGVVSWGSGSLGLNGTGSTADLGWATGAPAASRFVTISAGQEQATAVRSDAAALAWGGNADGELGNGTSTTAATATPGLVTTPGPATLAGATQTGGDRHAFATLTDGRIFLWGRSTQGQLGAGAATGPDTCSAGPCGTRARPALTSGVTALGGVLSAAAGREHTLAVIADGTIRSWGDNSLLQLGHCEGHASDASNPALVLLSSTALPGACAPTAPSALVLRHGTTTLANGDWTRGGATGDALTITAEGRDANWSEAGLRLFVEVRPVGTAFSGTCGVASGSGGSGVFGGAAVPQSVAWTTTSLSAMIDGLADGQSYQWRACIADATGAVSSTWSSPGAAPNIRVDHSAPAAVTDVAAAPNQTSGTVVLTWSAAADPTPGSAGVRYRVYRSSAVGTLGSLLNGGSESTTASYTDDLGPHPLARYFYTVRAYDAVGNERLLGNRQRQVTRVEALYLRSTSSTVTGSRSILTTAGVTADTATSVTLPVGATGNVQLRSGVANAAAPVGSLPSGPSGAGWVADPTDGTAYAAGAWRMHTRTITASAIHSSVLVARAWKVTLSGGAIATSTPISSWTRGTANISPTSTTGLGAPVATVMDLPVDDVTFGAGELLYVEYWARVQTAPGAAATLQFENDLSFDRILPTGSPASITLGTSGSPPNGPLVAGGDWTGTTRVTVTTTSYSGYSIHATDQSDTAAAIGCSGACSVPDHDASDDDPTPWATAAVSRMGFTVLDASTAGGRLPRWGSGAGTASSFSGTNQNEYVGLQQTRAALVHVRDEASAAGGDWVDVAYRANISSAQQAGSYSQQVTFSAVVNP